MLADFALFSTDHLAALAVTAAVAALLVAWARRNRGSPATRIPAWTLAAVLLVSQAAEPLVVLLGEQAVHLPHGPHVAGGRDRGFQTPPLTLPRRA